MLVLAMERQDFSQSLGEIVSPALQTPSLSLFLTDAEHGLAQHSLLLFDAHSYAV